MIGQFILRIVIWFLLTANFSLANIVIGVVIVLFLPSWSNAHTKLKDILNGLGKIVLAIPQAYIEALEMIWKPHKYEKILLEEVEKRRSAGLIFLDIFLITFTPKTIVLRYLEDGWYVVHHVLPQKTRRRNP
ncbi:MAG: Na+/H+ antiporter subunit E [Pseudanabaena sp.]|jgi:multicomponent Na+:H+ antiporter subunit E